MAATSGADEEIAVKLTRTEVNLLIRGLAEALQASIPEPERQAIRALVQKLRSQIEEPEKKEEPKS